MCSVRHQGERVGEIPKTQLGQYNEDVESDRDRKGTLKTGGRMAAAKVAVGVMFVCVVIVCHAERYLTDPSWGCALPNPWPCGSYGRRHGGR